MSHVEPPEATVGPWAGYQDAARRLNAVRQSASSAASEQAQAVEAAQQELAAVRARLAPQRARLVRDLGVPESDLLPQRAELAAAVQAVAAGPAAVVGALRQARATADAADACILAPVPDGHGHGHGLARLRNLLVYGPFALTVLVIQVVLYAIVSGESQVGWAVVWGLAMPVVAFALGWLTIGFAFGGGRGKVDRTPLVGALVCLAPVLVTCMGVGLFAVID